MDTRTTAELIALYGAIASVRTGGEKVAQQTIDTLELLANKHLAFEEIMADTLEKMRDLIMTLYDEQIKIIEAHNELEERVALLEAKHEDQIERQRAYFPGE